MHRRNVTHALFSLAAAAGTATAGAGCTVNGRSVLTLRSQPSPSFVGAGNGAPAGSDGPAATAAAGPAPASYAWCKGLRDESVGDSTGITDTNNLKSALDLEADVFIAVPLIAQLLCFPSDVTRPRRGALEAARRVWMQRLAADERDWAADLVPWAALRHADRMAMLNRVVYPQRDAAWSAAGPLEQWAMLSPRRGTVNASYYRADALPPTQAGRLGIVEQCLAAGGAGDEPQPAAWAICQPDIEALDLGALAAEVRSEAGRPLADRIALRAAAAEVQRRLPEHAAKVKQIMARDPAYAKLFELAKAARGEWQARAAARADLIAAVRAMEDAHATGSRKALAGCAARTWPLFAAAVGKLPAKRFENLRGDPASATTFFDAAIGPILQDPDAYLAANALVACEGATDHLTAALAGGLAHWPGFRGPRTAALTAIRLADLQPDRRGEQIAVPSAALPFAPEQGARSIGELRASAVGVIASITDRGDTVRVTFPATSELQDQCAGRRRTNRISRIDDSGNVIYESICTHWKTVRVDTTLRPVDVAKRYAAGLAAKRFVSIIAGVPEAVWARPGAPTPLAAFGALLR